MRKISSVPRRRRGKNVVMPPTLRYRSISNNRSSNMRTCSRLRMRPWLEGLLDRSECSILRWEDRQKKTFSIAWRHASSHGFDQSQHGDLFYMWAQHTGKLKANNCGNHSNNKSTFRCALHSLKDCIELTKKGDKRGEGAKRTYRFIDPEHDLYDRKRKRAFQKVQKIEPKDESSNCSLKIVEDSTDSSDTHSNEMNSSTINFSSSSTETALFFLESPKDRFSPVDFISDIKYSELMAAPTETMTSNYFFNTLADDGKSTEEFVSDFPDLPIGINPEIIRETQHNDITLEMQNLSSDDISNSNSVTFKQEPSPNDQASHSYNENLSDEYEVLPKIFLPNLSCGSTVKVQKITQEPQIQQDFQINYSLIQQDMLKQHQPYLAQEFSEILGNVQIILMRENLTMENIQCDETSDTDQKVTTEQQPILNDQSFAAMEQDAVLYEEITTLLRQGVRDLSSNVK